MHTRPTASFRCQLSVFLFLLVTGVGCAKKRADYQIDARATLAQLASDEFQGRGVGTEGIDKAADLIADAFDRWGFQPLGDNGTYFQNFEISDGTRPTANTALSSSTGDEKKNYTIDRDFRPVSFSAQAKFSGPVVFAGYGIKHDEKKYDDYEGIDVKDKIVIVMRYEPHDAEGKSRFGPPGEWSKYAELGFKANLAAEKGAKALILVNPANHHKNDVLVPFSARFRGAKAPLTFIHASRDVVDQWLKDGKAGSLKALQAKIDETGKPASVALDSAFMVEGNVELEKVTRKVKNVVARLKGSGKYAKENVVVGAHYDHLGLGGEESFYTGRDQVHNGADDNASGTTALLKIAEHFVRQKDSPARSIIFAAFTAEERGLLGSQHFVKKPPVRLASIASMLNLDMVGRVSENTLFTSGQGTAASFERFLTEADEKSPLTFKSMWKGGMGPSDHMSFAQKKIPVIFLHSGLHGDYHRPTDDVNKINFEGLDQAVAVAVDVTEKLLAMPREPYIASSDSAGPLKVDRGPTRASLGIIPDYGSEDVKGVRLSGTTDNSAAAKAGMREGDILIKFANNKIDSLYDLTDELSKARPGDKVKLVVLRDGKEVQLEATLTGRGSARN